MKSKRKKKCSAFSLIELSIVVLVIGILIAGITQSSNLISKFKTEMAQSVTTNSPVTSIRDLALWYETTLDSSFSSTDSIDGNPVYTWYDNNTQTSAKNHATNGAGTAYPNACTSCPTYIQSGINGLPVVRFDGVNDYMSFNGKILNGTNYTIFAVGSPVALPANNFTFFIGSTTGSITNHNIGLGWRNTSLIYFGDYIGGAEPISYSFSMTNSGNGAKIFTARFDQSSGKLLWINGGTNPGATNTGATGDTNATAPVVDNVGAMLGRFLGTYSNINIAEIIIFQRALMKEERQAVEIYLGKKYNIPLNP